MSEILKEIGVSGINGKNIYDKDKSLNRYILILQTKFLNIL